VERDYTPEALKAYQMAKAVYAIPEVKTVVDSFFILAGASGAFWLISKGLSRLALWVHDSLDFSLAVLFAVSYNIVLAVLYASVIAMLVAMDGKGGGTYLYYKIAGFIFVYFTLHVVYADRHGKLDEYGLLGYIGGVSAYILFILKPKYLENPVTLPLYDVVYFIMKGWVGRSTTILGVLAVVYQLLRKVAQGIIALFRRLSGGRKAVAALALFLLS
jgi:hypothetical protein